MDAFFLGVWMGSAVMASVAAIYENTPLLHGMIFLGTPSLTAWILLTILEKMP
jgi:hypothetical protein